MTPFEVLVFAVSLGSSLGLFLYFVLRSCIHKFTLHEHKKLIYILSPLFGLDLVLVLYYGISTIALNFIVGCIIAGLVGCLVGLAFYLCLVIFCRCLSLSPKHILALILSLVTTLGTGAGIFFVIKPHIPDNPEGLGVESGGAAILGGLMVFGAVGILAYLGDKIYRFTKRVPSKEQQQQRRQQPPLTPTVEDFQKQVEEGGFMLVTPTEKPSFEIAESTPIFEAKSPNYSLEESQLGRVGDKKIILTVEDQGLGNVYFIIYIYHHKDIKMKTVFSILNLLL